MPLPSIFAFEESVEAFRIEYPLLFSSKSAVVKITLPSAFTWSIFKSEFLPAILITKSSVKASWVVVAVIAPSEVTLIDFVKSLESGPTPIHADPQFPSSRPIVPSVALMFNNAEFSMFIKVLLTP